jgi:hypothetical protein
MVWLTAALAFLDQHQSAFSVLFAGIVACSTVVYAVLTKRLVDETRRLREAQTEPRLSILLDPKDEWINLIDMTIRNDGPSAAYQIRFRLEGDFPISRDKALSQLRVIRDGLPYLAPGHSMRFFFTSMVEQPELKKDARFAIEARYLNAINISYSNTFSFDFSAWEGLGRVGEPPLIKMAQAMADLQEDVHSVIQGLARLRTLQFTPEDLREEERRWKEMHERGEQQNIDAT